MKCFAIVPGTAAQDFSCAAWLNLTSGAVLLVQDVDYTSFSTAVRAVEGTMLPIFYDPSPLTSGQLAALAPIPLTTGANMLALAQAAAALNPLLGL